MAESDGTLADIQREEMHRLFGRLVTFRVGVLPVFHLLLAGLAAWDPTPARVGVAAATALVLTVVAVAEYVRHRRGKPDDRSLPGNLVVMMGLLFVVIGLSGGLTSPFLLVVGPAAAMAGVIVGVRPLLGVFVALPVGYVCVLAALQSDHAPATRLATAAVASAAILLAAGIGTQVRRTFLAMTERALSARERERAAHQAHLDEMVGLTGEIAHELKNPLATIHGLSSLLARDLSGRDAERLAVLRGEVGRMQTTLDEFLNFSRPLTPLARVSCDPVDLAESIAAMHEGMARDFGVRMRVTGEAPPVDVDPRKVTQVLVNLVQNALDAAPPSTEVELSIAEDRDGVAFSVLDRGVGLAADVAPRAFEPGVTSKPQGNGLGLTIARAIARQHGGDVALAPRDGGGTVARLILPRPSSRTP